LTNLDELEEYRLRVFENRMQRRMLEEVAGGWKRLNNVELCKLYTLPHFIWVIKPGRVK
jgi:hypothetical protein